MIRTCFVVAAALSIQTSHSFRQGWSSSLATFGTFPLAYPRTTTSSSTCLFGVKGPGNILRPPNEFSRQYKAASILRGGRKGGEYAISIKANSTELAALKKRFGSGLHRIDKLEAHLTMGREPMLPKESKRGIEVEGTCFARVSQICGRTGDAFDVDVEFNIHEYVRPIGGEEKSAEDEIMGYISREAKTSKKRKERRQNKVTHNRINNMNVQDIQEMLMNLDANDEEYDEMVFEDEGVYSQGVIDVGELVAQLFYLKLDPYPKKPGAQTNGFDGFSISLDQDGNIIENDEVEWDEWEYEEASSSA